LCFLPVENSQPLESCGRMPLLLLNLCSFSYTFLLTLRELKLDCKLNFQFLIVQHAMCFVPCQLLHMPAPGEDEGQCYVPGLEAVLLVGLLTPGKQPC